MNILLVSPMADGQSGRFIHDTFIQMGHRIAYFDWRHLTQEKGIEGMNSTLIDAITELKPDLTLIVKGAGLSADTIKKIREIHNHVIVGWIFDCTLSGVFLKDVAGYVDFVKQLDTFYTFDETGAKELKELGVNTKCLPQACYKPLHKEQVINSVQKKKYGSDIVFIGSVGGIHKNRAQILERLHKEGFNFKIYGDVLYTKDKEPDWVKDHHTGFAAIDDMHSLIINSSKIVLGIDGWPEREKAWSLRLYKTLCAGGFYLTTHTKDIEKSFELGKYLDTFKDEDDLIEKIIYWLQEDNKRQEVAKTGQKLILDKYTFENSLQEIINNK